MTMVDVDTELNSTDRQLQRLKKRAFDCIEPRTAKLLMKRKSICFDDGTNNNNDDVTFVAMHPPAQSLEDEESRGANLVVVLDACRGVHYKLQDAVLGLVKSLPLIVASSLLDVKRVKVAFVIADGQKATLLNDGEFSPIGCLPMASICEELASKKPSDLEMSYMCGFDAAMDALEMQKTEDSAITSTILFVSEFKSPKFQQDLVGALEPHVSSRCTAHPSAVFALVCGHVSEINYRTLDALTGQRGCYALTSLRSSSFEHEAIQLLSKLSCSSGCTTATVTVTSQPPPQPPQDGSKDDGGNEDDDIDEEDDEDDDENVDTNTPSQNKKFVKGPSGNRALPRSPPPSTRELEFEIGLVTPITSIIGRTFIVKGIQDAVTISATLKGEEDDTKKKKLLNATLRPGSDVFEPLDQWWKSFAIDMRDSCNFGLDVVSRVVDTYHRLSESNEKSSRTKRFVLRRLLDAMVRRSTVHTRKELLEEARKDFTRRRREVEATRAYRATEFSKKPFNWYTNEPCVVPGYTPVSSDRLDTSMVFDIRDALTCLSLCAV